MIADELHGHLAAAPKRNVGKLAAGGLFNGDGDDLVFLLRTGTANLHRAGKRRLERSNKFFRVFVGLLGIHPEHEFIERQHRYGRQNPSS